MKNLFYLVLTLSFVGNIRAQGNIPNGDTEVWSSFTGILGVQYWEPGAGSNRLTHFFRTLNEVADVVPGVVTTFRAEGAEVFSGTHSAKLVSNEAGVYFVPGFLGTGDISLQDTTIYLGRPWTNKAASMYCWVKYMPTSNDSGEVSVWFTRNESGSRILVGKGRLVFHSAVGGYSYFDVPVDYYDMGAIDTVVIVCTSSAGYNLNNPTASQGRVGSTMWIDDINFDYVFGINDDLVLNPKVQVYPNPATEIVNIQMSNLGENLMIRVYDASGRRIMEERVAGDHHLLNLSQLRTGQYLIVIQDNLNLHYKGRIQKL